MDKDIEKASVMDDNHPLANVPHQTIHHPTHGPVRQVLMDKSGKFLPPFGGEMQVAPYQPSFRKFANPGPLGLSAFALTTFVLSLLNLQTRGISAPAVVVGLAYGYGGLVQLLAGMWEMASGNTFAATALSSYGGFWISWAIINTGAFGIAEAYTAPQLQDVLGFYLMGWFIFTFLLLLCTMKSTVAFFLLFLTLDLAFLMLGLGHLIRPDQGAHSHVGLIKAGGVFGLLAAFLAWYNAYAGISESANSFLQVHVVHFPWSETRRYEKRESVSSA
jgi:succinate-acetate transporter protein